MLEKTKEIVNHYEELTRKLADPDVASDPKQFQQLAKKRHELEPVAARGKTYIELLERIEEDRSILEGDDPELKAIVREELDELLDRKAHLEEELRVLLLPRDPATTRMPLWRSGREREVKKPPCSRRICSACTVNTPNVTAGHTKFYPAMSWEVAD